MKEQFYSTIIEIDSVYTVLDLLEMEQEEKKELVVIVQQTVHHVVLDTVLSELSDDDKKTLLSHVVINNHEEIWNLLNVKTPNIHKKIRKAVDKLKKELHADIKKTKPKK